MNMLKKLFSLCLALAVILSLAVPAMAEGEEPAEDVTFTITINPSQSNDNLDSHKGHTYEAYQILSGEVATDDQGRTVLKNPAWGGKNFPVEAFIAALQAETAFNGTGASNLFSVLKAEEPQKSAQLFADTISALTFDTAQEEKLAEVVYNVINTYNSNAANADKKCEPFDTSSPKSDDPTVYELVVPAGFYMIMDKDKSLANLENKDYTDIILHVSDDVNIYHKGSIPTLTKAVSEFGSEYTDKIAVATATDYYYRLVGTLPDDFSNYSEYKYVLHDEMDPGITFVDVVEAYVPRGINEKEYLSKKVEGDENSHGYEVKKSADGQTVEIFFRDLKHGNNAHNLTNGDKIVVIYKARLNANAVIARDGNENSAKLIYSNNPTNMDIVGQTNSNNTKVYTYALQLNKYNGAKPEETLEGVEFVLYREHSVTTGSGAEKVTQVYKEYAVVNSTGRITSWEREATAGSDVIPTNASTLTTDAKGQIKLYGLDSRMDYFLKETKAVGTYNEIKEPIKIYLTATVDGNNVVNSIHATVTGSDCHVPTNNPNFYEGRVVDDNGTVTTDGVLVGVNLNIPNYLGAVLPSTGGIGTTVFYIAGAILVLGAVVLLVTKKRMS